MALSSSACDVILSRGRTTTCALVRTAGRASKDKSNRIVERPNRLFMKLPSIESIHVDVREHPGQCSISLQKDSRAPRSLHGGPKQLELSSGSCTGSARCWKPLRNLTR